MSTGRVDGAVQSTKHLSTPEDENKQTCNCDLHLAGRRRRESTDQSQRILNLVLQWQATRTGGARHTERFLCAAGALQAARGLRNLFYCRLFRKQTR